MVPRRQDLVAALIACAETGCRASARRFVDGLSADELQFIAEYLGACILDTRRPCCSRAELAARIAQFQQHRAPSRPSDQDHKMILLLEFLCRTSVPQASLAKSI